jgi:hypothetical protein
MGHWCCFFITYWATAGMPSPKIEAASARKLGPATSPVSGWIIHGPTVLTAAQAAPGDSVARPHRRRRAARRKGRTAPDDGRWMCHHGKNGTVTENDELWWVDFMGLNDSKWWFYGDAYCDLMGFLWGFHSHMNADVYGDKMGCVTILRI